MTFTLHTIVEEYLQELDKITEAREVLRNRIVDLYEQSYETDDDSERDALVVDATKMEQQVDAFTAKGNHYILKIDQLNGVR